MSNNSRLPKILMILTILSTGLCLGLDIPSSKNEKPGTITAQKKQSARSTKKYFLIKTVEGEELSRRLAESVETISHPFCHIVTGGGTLVDTSEHQQKKRFSLGKFYNVQGDVLDGSKTLGSVSLRLGGSPISFETDQCRWMGQSIRCEFHSPKGDMTAGLKLTREIYVDRQGNVYVSFRISGSTKAGRELLKTGKLRFYIEPERLQKSRWRVWHRLPDGSLRRPDSKREDFECELSSDSKKSSGRELLIVAVPTRESERLDSISSDEVEFESKISRHRPIGSMQSAMRRWIVDQFPGWDCPEPWLNKLWAGQVVSICQELAVDGESGELFIPVNSPEDSQLLYDVRWLRDSKIARQSLQLELGDLNKKSLAMGGWIGPATMAILECKPDTEFRRSIIEEISPMIDRWAKEVTSTQTATGKARKIQKENNTRLLLANYCVLAEWSAGRNNVFQSRAKRLAAMLNTAFPAKTTSLELSELLTLESSVTDYPTFVQWCRSFFSGGDFSWLIDLRIDSAHRRVKKKIPRGVMDMIITKVVGVKTNSTDRLTIAPASWIKHWPYFAVDNLPYRGHNLTVVWQSPDHVQRYAGIPLGLSIFVDGQCVKQMQKLETVEIELR